MLFERTKLPGYMNHYPPRGKPHTQLETSRLNYEGIRAELSYAARERANNRESNALIPIVIQHDVGVEVDHDTEGYDENGDWYDGEPITTHATLWRRPRWETAP